jgi:hypothetical protein
MKQSVKQLIWLGCVVWLSVAAQAKPNFTGEWKLNSSKSDFGPFPAPSAMTQKQTHDEPALKVQTTMVTDNGEFSWDSTYKTDDSETINRFGPNEMKSKAVWQNDTLTITTKGQFGANEITMEDKWDLSEDGKTITIRRHMASSQGELDQKLILEKQ